MSELAVENLKRVPEHHRYMYFVHYKPRLNFYDIHKTICVFFSYFAFINHFIFPVPKEQKVLNTHAVYT